MSIPHELVRDLWPLVVHHLCTTDIFRAKGDVARDAAALALTNKDFVAWSDAAYMTLTGCERRARNTCAYRCPVPWHQRRDILSDNWIDVATVRMRFMLTPAERIGLRARLMPGGQCQWYLRDVRNACLAKYGGREGWDAHVLRLENDRKKRYETALRKQIERNADICRELMSIGDELRGYSRLCERYIRTGKGDPEAIAVVVDAMSSRLENGISIDSSHFS